MKKITLFLTITTLLTILSSCGSDNEAQTSVTPPNITSFSPTKGYIGDTITITGTNFLSDSKILISNTNATIISISSEEIKTIVHDKVIKGNNPIQLISNNKTFEVGDFDAIIDDYKYLIYDNLSAKLFKIGNNTGNVEFINTIPIENPYDISSYGFVKKGDLFYLMKLSTGENNNTLLTYNINTGTISKNEIVLPNSIKGGITALTFNPNNNKLIGLVNENIYSKDPTIHHFIEINPDTKEVVNKKLSFTHSLISSLLVKNQDLFLFSSTYPFNLSKINLNDYSIKSISSENNTFSITKPVLNFEKDIICLHAKESNSALELIKFDEQNNSTTTLLNNVLNLNTPFGNGYFDTNSSEYIGIFVDPSIDNSKGNQPTYSSLLKFGGKPFNQTKVFFRPKKSFSSPTIIDIID